MSSVRPQKGHSVIAELTEYIALDLETTGLDPKWDSIIEIGAVHIRNGETVEKFHSMVNPETPIDEFITELTGITNEMLASAPTVQTVLPKLMEFIGDMVVVAHNANFDVNFIYDACDLFFDAPFANDFVDTMRMSRKLFPDENHHRMKDLIKRFGMQAEITHRAENDAVYASMCYEYMIRYIKENNIDLQSFNVSTHKPKLKASDVLPTCDTIDETSPAYNKVFVFTGALEHMTRKDAMQLVVNAGGKCADSVVKNTNFLVLGNNDYCKSIKDGKSSKQKKAEKLQLSGSDIQTISENVFLEILGVSIE